jgi:hypothetical protein
MSPYYGPYARPHPAIAPELEKFNLPSILPSMPAGRFGLGAAGKPLTMETGPSIKPSMAAGAILPPLFFERRLLESNFAPRTAFSGTPGNATASIAE